MSDKTQLIVGVAVATFIVVILAAINTMLSPTLQGVGAQTAGAMGANTTAFYTAIQGSATNAATGYAATNSIVPYLAIAFGILAALGISLAAYFKLGKKGGSSRSYRSGFADYE
jgi:hypothetical protein